jgi:hypothetical protein
VLANSVFPIVERPGDIVVLFLSGPSFHQTGDSDLDGVCGSIVLTSHCFSYVFYHFNTYSPPLVFPGSSNLVLILPRWFQLTLWLIAKGELWI